MRSSTLSAGHEKKSLCTAAIDRHFMDAQVTIPISPLGSRNEPVVVDVARTHSDDRGAMDPLLFFQVLRAVLSRLTGPHLAAVPPDHLKAAQRLHERPLILGGQGRLPSRRLATTDLERRGSSGVESLSPSFASAGWSFFIGHSRLDDGNPVSAVNPENPLHFCSGRR